jgi:transcriptional regulator with XRE-family HTH domain
MQDTLKKKFKKITTKQSMISQWITGKRNPTLRSLEKIAVVTGKPLSYFIYDSNNASVNFNVQKKLEARC